MIRLIVHLKKRSWHILFAALITFSLTTTASATEPLFLTEQEQAWLRNHPTPLRIHNEMEWKPFNYNEKGVPKGYSIDYMNMLAKKLGIQVEYISGPTWDEFLDMMKAGTLDIMLNIANTKERRQYLRFTDPYHITTVGLYTHSTENNITDLDHLNGKRLGFTEGFFFGEFIRLYYPKINVVTFPSTQASFVGVQEGQADAAIDVPLVANSILRDMNMTDVKFAGKVSDPVFITTFSLGTRKDNPVLQSILQKAIDSVTSDEIKTINDKWAINTNRGSRLSPQDLDYLKTQSPLRLCVNPKRLPLEAINLETKLTGISSEFVERLRQITQISLNIVPTSSWEESLNLVKKHECDVVPMAVKSATTQALLNFTSPWLSLEQVIVTRNDQIYIDNLDRLNDHRVGIVRGQSTKQDLLAIYPGLTLVEVDSVFDGLKQVSERKLFGFIDTLATTSRVMQTNKLDNVKISGSVGVTAKYAVGVRNNDGKLLSILERATRSIEPADINAMYNRWLSIAYVERFDYTRFWQAFIVFSLLTAYIYHRYRQGQKTAALLRQANNKVETANKELDRLARTDPLTGLANRLETDEALHKEYARFERYQYVFSIIMLDIDHFKSINDTYGHEVGDKVLVHISSLLKAKCRESDLIGRWGGEEFLIVCPSTDTNGTIKLADHLREATQNAHFDGLPQITISLGVATIHSRDSIDDLMRRADDALYQAKNNGRNRVELAKSYEPA